MGRMHFRHGSQCFEVPSHKRWLHSRLCVGQRDRERGGAQVSGVQHVRVEALEQRLAAAGGCDAARAALDAQIFEHEVLHHIAHSLLFHPAHGSVRSMGASS